MCLILAATRRLEDRHQNISLKSRSTSPCFSREECRALFLKTRSAEKGQVHKQHSRER